MTITYQSKEISQHYLFVSPLSPGFIFGCEIGAAVNSPKSVGEADYCPLYLKLSLSTTYSIYYSSSILSLAFYFHFTVQ